MEKHYETCGKRDKNMEKHYETCGKRDETWANITKHIGNVGKHENE